MKIYLTCSTYDCITEQLPLGIAGDPAVCEFLSSDTERMEPFHTPEEISILERLLINDKEMHAEETKISRKLTHQCFCFYFWSVWSYNI